ncbi:MAG: hypothetical protein ACOYJD_09550 [Christensenellales bacterium]
MSLEKDMGITVDGTWYPIYQDAAPLLASIGEDYELFAAPSCLFTGEDKEFSYDSCSVFTNPDGDKDIWYIIDLKDATYSTSRNIRVGNTADDLISAYGEKYYWESDYQMVYSISNIQGDLTSPCIMFDLEDDVITKIGIYYPTNMG